MKTCDEYLSTCIHDEYYHSLIREGWNAAIKSVNTEMLQLLNGIRDYLYAGVFSEKSNDSIIDQIDAVLAQQQHG